MYYNICLVLVSNWFRNPVSNLIIYILILAVFIQSNWSIEVLINLTAYILKHYK